MLRLGFGFGVLGFGFWVLGFGFWVRIGSAGVKGDALRAEQMTSKKYVRLRNTARSESNQVAREQVGLSSAVFGAAARR